MSGFPSRNDLLTSRLSRFARALHGVEEGNVPAIHRTRVASRRLREVLPVLQLDPRVASKLSKKLRKVTRRLGPPRELDVLLQLLEELDASGRYAPRALRMIKADVSRRRRRHAEKLAEKDTGALLRRTARLLGRAVEVLDGADTDAEQARAMRRVNEARVGIRAEGLNRAIAAAGQVYLAERLHEVRIALKKLRYGVELAVEMAGNSDSPELKVLKRGQELLGRMHDLQVLIDRVRHVQGELAPPDLTVWRELDAVITTLEHSCRRLHGRYMHERPALLALAEKYRGRRTARTGLAVGQAG